MQIIRGRLSPQDYSNPSIRYNTSTDKIQFTPDGGTTWVDTPSADPRHGDSFRLPVLTTGDVKCDAAANMVKWLKDFIDSVTELLGAGATAFGLVNTALSLMTAIFEPSALLLLVVGACETLFGIGATALTGAFTSDQYDLMLCIFYCLVDDNGQVSESAFAVIEDQMTDQLNTTAALVTNLILSMQGEVGLSNAGVIGGQTGDCSGCDDCDWVVEYDFSLSNYGFNVLFSSGQPRGYYTGSSFIGTNQGGTICVFLYKAAPGLDITGMAAFCTLNHGTGLGSLHRTMNLLTASPVTVSTIGSAGVTDQVSPGWQTDTPTFTSTAGWAMDWNGSTNGTGAMEIFKIRLRGTGTPPTDGVRVNSL